MKKAGGFPPAGWTNTGGLRVRLFFSVVAVARIPKTDKLRVSYEIQPVNAGF